MRPAAAELAALLRRIDLRPPELPILSNVTGTWMRAEDATDPDYWLRHLVGTVRFADGVAELLRERFVLLEVGPGQTLSSWALQCGRGEPVTSLASLRHALDPRPDHEVLLGALGQLWLAGVTPDWRAFHEGVPRRRVPLPTYPFERRRYWIDPPGRAAQAAPELPPAEVADGRRPHPRPGLRVAYAAPRSALEARLAALWGQMLRLDHVGVHDNFFDLGGDSLLATRLISIQGRELGVELSLRELFEAPTVAELAVRLEAAGRGGAVPPLRPVPRGEDLPLSFAQERLWFLDRLVPGSPAYNIPSVVRARGGLDAGVLRRSLAALVRRHETLRTTFAEIEGAPVQVIALDSGVELPVIDLRAVPPERRGIEAHRLALEEARRPFDLARGPLLRTVLLRVGEGEETVLFTLHHIAGDGWSMGVLVREVGELYGALLAHRPPPLPELPVQYADFALWQRQWLAGAVVEEQLSYWRQQLAGLPDGLDLPLDRPRPAQPDLQGGRRSQVFPEELRFAVHDLGREQGATFFMVALAAFATLLSRLSGQTDVVTGSPIANRNRLEIEGLIGFFVNTLVLRVDTGGSPGFVELLERAREVVLGASLHQDLPFDRLVDDLAPQRSLGRTPLFQVMFVLQNAPFESLTLPGLSLAAEPGDTGVSNFDLTLELFETGEVLRADLHYRTALFDATTALRLLEHFRTLLAGVVADPHGRLSELPLLSPGETAQLLREWNDARSDYPAETSIQELFAEQVKRAPDAVAVVFGAESCTYRELDDRARRLAGRLRELGAGPGVPVAICLERSLDTVVAMLAVLQTGGAYVPLDVAYPAERLAFLLEDCGAPVVITRETLLDRLPAHGMAPHSAAPESLACVIYTSGSTGRPKGVAVPHRAVVRLVRNTNYLAVRPDDVVAQTSSTAFDAATFEIWGALLNGARLVGVARETALSPSALAEQIRRDGITVLFLTTALFNQVARERPDALASLRALFFGGEAADPAAARTCLERGAPQRLLHVYGPTESAAYASWHRVADVPAGAVTVPIGLPVGNTTLVVLDRDLMLLPAGVAGELCVGGDGLAWGYLDRPELTAERFVPDPFAETAGERLYRTGDLVRRRADGALEFLGRTDLQVKIRGVRIEPGEIEAALLDQPGVREAAVLARGEGSDRLLVACVAVAPPAALTAADLRAALAARLPEAMIPAAWVFLDALPLTPNGKVDRRALERLAPASPEPIEETAPRTPTEEVLAAIWADLLGRERVGVREDFFAIGGHSLLGTRLISRVRQAFGVELPLSALFEAPTVAELAARLETAGREALPPLRPAPREGVLPTSFAQERLWFLDRLMPGSPAYNIPSVVSARGGLDVGVLGRSLAALARRHETLRTTFAETADGPAQVIAPHLAVELPVIDLRAVPGTRREAEARRLALEEARRPFDLARGPVLRATLLRVGDGEETVLFTLHHIAGDGWSMGVLVREVGELYGALLAGRPPLLPELPVQYADFALWQRRWLTGEVVERQLAYWRRQLAGLPDGLDLPLDRPRPALPALQGDRRVRTFPEDLRLAMHRLGREQGATFFMVALAAFAALLSRLTGQSDVVTGSPVAGRNRLEIEGLIGFFVNTLVLRVDTGGAPGFVELLARAREVALGASLHQDLPFDRLVDDLAPQRNLGRTPLFQVMFAVQNAPFEALTLEGLSLQAAPGDTGTSGFDLTLELFETGEGLEALLQYRTALFDATTVDRFLRHFETLLASLVREPAARIAEAPILTPVERQQIREWNTTQPVPASDLLHRRVEAQAARTPHATALAQGEREMTYAELNARANQLGRFLSQRGVGPGTFVGVCLERSFDLLIALLGTLKAGGCYVPLDPAYPSERWTYTLENAGIRVLLTQESLLPLLPEPHWEVLCLDRDRHRLDACPAEDPPPASAPEDLLFVIYTSGSTGRPKGAVMFQRSFLNLVDWYVAAFGLREDDSFLLISSIAFDLTQKTVFSPLVSGGRLIIPLPGPYDPAAHLASIERHGITRLNCTPSTFYPLLDQEEDFPRLASLRGLSLGGEPISLARLERWRRSPWCRAYVLNTYGPTECTDLTSCHRLEPPGERALVSIGRPLTGVQVWVLSRELVPVPVGVTGQMYAAGINLTAGYLGQPAMTAERFLPDPFSEIPGERMYWLGDLGRWLPNGELEYLGRGDFQIKLRGFRIEPAEIEGALAQHPAVREAVVMARGEEDRRLVAWLAVGGGPAPEADELRSFLAGRLPDYMIPSAFVPLAALPLTPSGKVDRRALTEPEATRPELEAEYVAPRTAEEEALAEVWAEVLEVDRVGVHDNFFALGGDSIRSVRVLSLARARGLDFSLPQLFQHQTIAELVPHRLAEPATEEIPGASGPLSLLTAAERAALPPDVEDAYPLSALQLGMLFHSGFDEDVAEYHNVSTLRLSRALDMAALRAAVDRLAGRHPVLRASFDLGAFSRPLQLVHRAAALPVTEEDLRGLAPAEREAAVARRFAEERADRFAWERPPLLRFHVQHLAAGETQLFWTMHHAILDGWSVAMLLSELFRIYQAELAGAELAPAPATTFREFIALERAVLESDEARGFWSDRLRGADFARLLPWHPDEEDKDRAPVSVPLPEPIVAGLARLAGLRDLASAVPPKSVFLAAHLWVVGRVTGTRDVVTGLVTNGRPEAPDADRVLGLFLNTVPLRAVLGGGTWLDLARQAFATEREILPFRRFPLPEIQRDLSVAQLFETSFNYVDFHVLAETEEASGLQLGSTRAFDETNIPLAVDFIQDSARGTVRLSAQRNPTVVNQDQLRAVVDLYLRVLSAMALEPGARYDTADLLAPAERQQILREWNDTALESHLESEVVHEVFERWAEWTPEAPALRSSQGELSYRDLNRQANRIAHSLREQGAGPEVAVGLYVERSPEMIAGLLGILKAGAAYVPLDPAYPRERLLTLIEDLHVPLVLTRERLIDSLGETGPEDDANPRSGVVGDNLAYAIFTSGSTGKPKPVGVSHRALTRHMAGTRQVLHMTGRDTVLQFSTLNFDGSVDQVFIALVNGACLALREEEMWSAEELEERIAEMGLTIIDLPTGYWSEWVRARSSAPAREDNLRVVYVGGEAMLAEELAVWWRSPRNHNVRLLNAYGPTETVVAASYLEATSRESAGPLFERVAIGHPLRGRALHVVDPDGRLSPVGVSGELLIGGEPILARGYLGRPDLTAERFVPDPFSPVPGARLYRTGDLGRYLPDGRREFLGRVDDQVKVRGFRIEPGEVEAALSEHPAVYRAAVVVHGKRLVAYVTTTGGAPTAEELRAFLHGKLPEPMVPSDVVFLDRLPLTPNGKVDRRALPAPDLSAGRAVQAPRSEVELQLVGIWEELLELSPIGVTDDFLELGGHSLLAVRLMARIERVFGVKLPISTLFEAPTVERLAQAIQDREAPVRRSPVVRLHPGGAGRPLFVVHPVGGDVFAYVELAKKLGADRPVYGLQSVAQGNGHPSTMEELAARYVAAVREVQPEGPYLLAGWSLGAVIAYEMAQQVELSGGTVALLAMIDPSSPAENGNQGSDDLSLLADFASDLVRLSGRAVPFGREVLAGLDVESGLARLLELGRVEGVLPPDVDTPRLRERFALFARHVKALEGYVPRPYGGRVALFRASGSLAPGVMDPASGWAALTTAEVHLLDADHYTLLQRPALDLLVEHLAGL